jgi:6,7-dimethyl-8-ribityllumazine synthase
MIKNIKNTQIESNQLQRVGANFEEIVVAGAFEVPAAISLALDSEKFDGFVALGCVIRGETSHYDYVCVESARGIMELNIQADACIGYGILTVENMEQAITRARISEGNKGRDAVEAALQLIEIKRKYGK